MIFIVEHWEREREREKTFVLPPSQNQMSNMQNSWVLHIHDSELSSSPGPLSQLDESPGEEEEDDLCRSSRQPSSVGRLNPKITNFKYPRYITYKMK